MTQGDVQSDVMRRAVWDEFADGSVGIEGLSPDSRWTERASPSLESLGVLFVDSQVLRQQVIERALQIMSLPGLFAQSIVENTELIVSFFVKMSLQPAL